MSVLQKLLDKQDESTENVDNLSDLLEKTAEELENLDNEVVLREQDIIAMSFVEADQLIKMAELIENDK